MFVVAVMATEERTVDTFTRVTFDVSALVFFVLYFTIAGGFAWITGSSYQGAIIISVLQILPLLNYVIYFYLLFRKPRLTVVKKKMVVDLASREFYVTFYVLLLPIILLVFTCMLQIINARVLQ